MESRAASHASSPGGEATVDLAVTVVPLVSLGITDSCLRDGGRARARVRAHALRRRPKPLAGVLPWETRPAAGLRAVSRVDCCMRPVP